MKALKHLWLLIFALGFSGCDKEEEMLENPNVESYVRLLKSNQYNSSDLPAFTPKDIPALLQYRNETQLISDFPRNPISSYYNGECTLGTYILWTVESIRAVSTNSEYLMGRFPSQNPVLEREDAPDLTGPSDGAAQSVAAQAYSDWWENNKNKEFDDFNTVNPLAGTGYRWH